MKIYDKLNKFVNDVVWKTYENMSELWFNIKIQDITREIKTKLLEELFLFK